MADDDCRVDVWLWRARFCKTRALAAKLVESGRIRLTRSHRQVRLEKPSRTVRPGDELVFAVGGRLTAVRVDAVGWRRGPPAEARGLFTSIDGDGASVADQTSEAGERGDGEDERDDLSSRH